MTPPLFVFLTLITGWGALTTPALTQGEAPPEVRVMSYNIRFGTANDGENHWDKRKAFLVDTIKAFDPDILGTQETLAFQRDYLADKLPKYASLGVGRDDGKDAGEMTAVFWRKDRFEKLDEGHFWLSETPNKPGSKSWDAALPRMATWVKLRDKQHRDAKPIFFLNTHFDHKGDKARLEAAKLIREKLGTLGKGCVLIVTGDFNAGEASEPHSALFGKHEGKESPLLDTFRAANPELRKDVGTFSGFDAARTGGARIDWIGCSHNWTIRKAEIDRTERKGRTPSDHFAVTAVLKW